jgi:hypothetical protein
MLDKTPVLVLMPVVLKSLGRPHTYHLEDAPVGAVQVDDKFRQEHCTQVPKHATSWSNNTSTHLLQMLQ